MKNIFSGTDVKRSQITEAEDKAKTTISRSRRGQNLKI